MWRRVSGKKLKIAALVAALSIGLTIFLISNNRNGDNPPFKTDVPWASAQTTDIPFGPKTFAEVAKRENPAVVNISTTKVLARQVPEFRFSPRPRGPFGDPFEEFFERFFGERPPELKRRSLGSGFIISSDGYILTNYHVVEKADEIKVVLYNEKEYDAKVVGTDPKTDVALIKIEAENLPLAALGDSDTLEVGDWVVAIGNPFGLSRTVTVGVVSAKGRIIGAGPYDDFIQTDASINFGNSGGPLINVKGEVVGINSAIYQGASGIGFAIPINLVKNILPELREIGSVTRGWLGVTIQRLTPELAESFGLKDENGALVASVIPGSPADKAGIVQGDIIRELNKVEVKSMEELPRMVANIKPGEKVEVAVLRNGKPLSLSVELGKLEEASMEAEAVTPKDASETVGMTVQEITPDIASSLNLQDTKGVIVSYVEPGSLAGEAGIERGDIIRQINRENVNNIDDYDRIIADALKNKTILFLIQRGDSALYMAVRTG